MITKLFANVKDECIQRYESLRVFASAKKGKMMLNSEMFEFLVDFYDQNKEKKQ